MKLKMEVQWLRNGHAPETSAPRLEIAFPGPDPLVLRNSLEAAFRQTGFIVISEDDAAGTVKV
ncbi:hypothetical protein, partial [Salmonella enterica]|uniref:hypothetical protein n=1 Tax=Salmonella enterica TaxID=28901 RepID=UPI003CF0C361